jgi:exopolysaccharide/PEP-CTERM locus tyrosine autokinase
VGKIFDALEKFSKERGAAVSNRITDSDYEALMQFDDATGRIDIENPKIAKDPGVLKRLKTYRLINEDGTLTPAGRVKYEEMARKAKKKDAGGAAGARAAEKQAFEKEANAELISRKFVKTTHEDWALLMTYDRKSGNLLKYDSETAQLDEDSKKILQDPATIQRLIDNQMILPGGWLTPEAKRECSRLEEKLRDKKTNDTAKQKEIATADTRHQSVAPAEVLGQAEMQALLDYDAETLKLNMSNPIIVKEPAIVKRLLEGKMIEPDGKLTPQALVRCRVLSLWKHELEQKKGTPKKPKESIGEKLQSIAEKEKPRKTSGQDGEKKLKIIPLEKNKTQENAEAKTAAKKEEEKIPEKADDITPAAEARVHDDLPKPEKTPEKADAFVTALEEKTDRPEPVAAPSERKFTLGEAHARYDRNAIDKNLVSFLNPLSFEAEQFKILRTNLLFPASGKAPRSIMVTSVAPGEGKSFVAANLAVSVAAHVNWNVLLIDCDLRRPTVHRQFGFPEVPGLSDYLSNGRDLPSLLLRTDIERLTILPGGRPPDNPSELLSSERMEAFIDEVASRYKDRLIILDSPPPRLTAESTALARRVDGILLVVKYAKTPRNAANELINKLGKEKVLGAIVNNFDAGFARYQKKYYGGTYYGK